MDRAQAAQGTVPAVQIKQRQASASSALGSLFSGGLGLGPLDQDGSLPCLPRRALPPWSVPATLCDLGQTPPSLNRGCPYPFEPSSGGWEVPSLECPRERD